VKVATHCAWVGGWVCDASRLITDVGWALTVAATVGALAAKRHALARASVPAPAKQQRT
jgi:hypothetical protein